MWNTCSGWMELELTLLSIRRTSPYLPLHHNLNHSLPFRHFSSLLLFFLLLPNLGGVGVAGLKLRGLWGQYDWAQVRGWAAIGWLMGGQAASSCPHLTPGGHRPSYPAPFTPRVPPKTQPTWPSASALTQNAPISCFFLQILRASSKFWIFSIIDNNLHQFRGRRHLEDLSVNIRMRTSKNLPHLHLASPPLEK